MAPPTMPHHNGKHVKTTARSLDIVESIRQLNGARLTEIADDVELPNSTVHNHLSTLENRGYVVKQGHQYHVGLRFLNIGEYARRTREAFLPAQAELDDLAEETGETAVLLTVEDGVGVVLYVSSDQGAVPLDLHPGKRISLPQSGIGQAFLAYLSDEQINSIIEENCPPTNDSMAISDSDEMHAILDGVRDKGYAVNTGGRIPGVTSVGTAIKDDSGSITAAIGVIGASGSLDDIKSLSKRVKNTANIIELRIAHS